MIFRLQNNVPPVYVEQSRDFQLLCRLMDCSQGNLKYDIDTIVNVLDASSIRDSLLQLLCTKVGFFPDIDINASTLKYIVAAFPYLLKYKGTELGIKYAVWTILKAEFVNSNINAEPRVVIYRDNNELSYTISIEAFLSDYNRQALEAVLFYIKPIGFSYVLITLNTIAGDKLSTTFAFKEYKDYIAVDNYKLGSIVGETAMYIGDKSNIYGNTPLNPIYGDTEYGNQYGREGTYQGKQHLGTGNVDSYGLIDPKFIGYSKILNQSDIDKREQTEGENNG